MVRRSAAYLRLEDWQDGYYIDTGQERGYANALPPYKVRDMAEPKANLFLPGGVRCLIDT